MSSTLQELQQRVVKTLFPPLAQIDELTWDAIVPFRQIHVGTVSILPGREAILLDSKVLATHRPEKSHKDLGKS